jgi:glycosyltransferase involved in cell wall biosynthesis
MLSQFYPPIVGGEERIVEDLSVELARRGHSVAVATLRQSGVLEPFEVRNGVRIHRLSSTAARVPRLFAEQERRHAPPAPDPETVLDLRRVVERERPEIVHAHNWLVHSFLPLRRSTRAALVVSLHDYSLVCATKTLFRAGAPCAGPGPVKCLVHAARHYGIVKGGLTAAALGVMGPFERQAVELFLPVSRAVAAASGLDRYPHMIIPNFVRFDDGSGLPSEDRRLAQLPEGDFILFVGDVTPAKGVETLVEALALLPEAELVVAGIGVQPNVELARDAGLEVRDGIVVDERFATSKPGVYAVGDVAEFFDPVFARHRRIEHWSNAAYHGTTLGAILAGDEDARYDTVSSFFSEEFGRSFRTFGDPTGHDVTAYDGDFREADAVFRFLRRGRTVGAVTMGLDDDAQNALKDEIRAGAATSA